MAYKVVDQHCYAFMRALGVVVFFCVGSSEAIGWYLHGVMGVLLGLCCWVGSIILLVRTIYWSACSVGGVTYILGLLLVRKLIGITNSERLCK